MKFKINSKKIINIIRCLLISILLGYGIALSTEIIKTNKQYKAIMKNNTEKILDDASNY